MNHRTPDPRPANTAEAGGPAWPTWTNRVVALAGVLVVAWVCLTVWGAVVHGHPAYAVLLGLTVLACAFTLWRSFRQGTARTRRRRVLDVVLAVAGIGWIAAVAWLRPYEAVEPSPSALTSDGDVSVTESATHIELAPTADADGTAVFFRPGAKVEARAYAAVLRPLAEAGHTVVITKQPLGIAFLDAGAFDETRARFPEADRWVVGGHSLGGVVASTEADTTDADGVAPAVGLLLYASYPAEDVSGSLMTAVESVSGSEDGLSTPAEISASRADLPAGSTFTVVEGAVHAYFADYGPQPGDGTPEISHDEARTRISDVSVRFVGSLSGTAQGQ